MGTRAESNFPAENPIIKDFSYTIKTLVEAGSKINLKQKELINKGSFKSLEGFYELSYTLDSIGRGLLLIAFVSKQNFLLVLNEIENGSGENLKRERGLLWKGTPKIVGSIRTLIDAGINYLDFARGVESRSYSIADFFCLTCESVSIKNLGIWLKELGKNV